MPDTANKGGVQLGDGECRRRAQFPAGLGAYLLCHPPLAPCLAPTYRGAELYESCPKVLACQQLQVLVYNFAPLKLFVEEVADHKAGGGGHF